jgi:CRP-like cAMP-binding protein
VIESGEAAVWQDDRQLRTLRDGDFFGELAILRTGERTASVVAKTQMRLITVTETGFRQLVKTDPAAAQACEAAIAERSATPTSSHEALGLLRGLVRRVRLTVSPLI